MNENENENHTKLTTSTLSNAIDILKDLIGFAAVNGQSNEEMVNYITNFLESRNATVTHIRKAPSSPDSPSSIVAALGPEDAPEIIFSGHIDVVSSSIHPRHSGWWCYHEDVSKTPHPPQKWSFSPFICEEKDGKIYGRGACDMLGGIACLLSLIPRIQQDQLTHRIIIALTCDEESDMKAASTICETGFGGLSRQKPIGCLILEPTEMRPIVAQKGIYAATVHVQGKSSHLTRMDMAIHPVPPLLKAMNSFERATLNYSQLSDPDFIPKTPNCHMFNLSAEWGDRATPSDGKFSFSIQYPPTLAPTRVLSTLKACVTKIDKELKQRDETCGAHIATNFVSMPFEADMTSPFIRQIMSLTHTPSYKVSFVTEAGVYSHAGIPTLVIGPGSPLQAHTADEFVEKSQLHKLCGLLWDIHDNILTQPANLLQPFLPHHDPFKTPSL